MKKTLEKILLLPLLISNFAVGPLAFAASAGAPSMPPPLPPAPSFGIPSMNSNASHASLLPPEVRALPEWHGLIRGRVIEQKSGEPIGNAKVSIPELKISTKSDENGDFTFNPIKVNPTEGLVEYVTITAHAPGFGNHTMTDVALAPKDAANVTLAITKGEKPTKWYGIIRNKVRKPIPEPKGKEKNASTFSPFSLSVDSQSNNTFLVEKIQGDIRIAVGDNNTQTSAPKLTLSRWDEVSLSVSLPARPGQTIKQEGDKVIWSDPEKQVRFYELPASPDLPEGGYEIDIVYDKKPASNVVTMKIDTANLDFFYQPPLNEIKHSTPVSSCTATQCVDAAGRVVIHRPEHVVESYAVYYANGKSGDYTMLGSKNYYAGKAFHIYRPKISDSASNTTWGDLKIDTTAGTLTVTVPQEFLDKATYPVIVDPTFGYGKVAETESSWNTGTVGTDGKWYAPSTEAIGTHMTMYGRSADSSANVQMALYDINGKLAASSSALTFTGTNGWATSTLQHYPALSAKGGGYNQAFNPAETIYRRYDTGMGTPVHKEATHTYGTWPNTISWTNMAGQEKWSLYTTYSAVPTPPNYIYLAIFELTATGSPILPPDEEPIYRAAFDLDFYVKHVLPNEWGVGVDWPEESLRAGALTVKAYGWYYAQNPGKFDNSDCDNSTRCQVFNPYLSYARTDAAVDFMSGTGILRNGSTFIAFHLTGTEDSALCYTNEGERCVSQLGTKYWAEPAQGSKNWRWILDYYYEDPAQLTYFNIAPRWPETYQSAGSSNSITLNFSSASTTYYHIYKWNGTQWVTLATTTSTTYTDSGLTSGQGYFYAVNAFGPGGWSKSTFNNGYIKAFAKSASNPAAPITNVFFVSTSTMKLYATSTASSIQEYQVDEWNGVSWVNVVATTSPTVINDRGTYNGDDNHLPLPNVYIDKTGEPTGEICSALRCGSFVYTDTGLTANTAYFYRVRIKVSDTWSQYTNHDGYMTVYTAQN